MTSVVSGSTRAPSVEIRNLSKSYGSFRALDDVCAVLHEGEFVALLGPNGAGKSTLIKVLDGLLQPDAGEVRAGSGDLRDAVGVVHQDLGLIDELTVAENLFLGCHGEGTVLHLGSEAKATVESLALVGLHNVSPTALVAELSLGEQALVATARLLRGGARVIIVDEITASLPKAEAAWLIDHLREATDNGATVVMVTHRLDEIVGVVDRFLVIVDGKVALDEPGADVTLERLASTMAPDRPVPVARKESHGQSAASEGDVVVRLDAVKTARLGPLSLELRRGQVTGIAGSAASGFHDVAYMVAGLLSPTSGSVTKQQGLTTTCVPARRETDAVFPDQSVAFNITAGNWRRWRSPIRLLKLTAQHREVCTLADEFHLVPRQTDVPMGSLSGGNQQKALLARAVADEPGCIALCEPTRGVDVATRHEIYRFVRRLADSGTALVVVSSDVEDLVQLSDRILVIGEDGQLERCVESPDVMNFSEWETA